MTDLQLNPITDASIWSGADLLVDRSWEYTLGREDLSELGSALAAVRKDGLQVMQITNKEFLLPNLGRRLSQMAEELQTGRGFVLVHGFPVSQYSYEDLEILYWGLCSHIGTGLTQNGDGSFIHYVTDGKKKPSQGRRGVGFPKEAQLHIDLTDIVSLLCVRQAPDDPVSWVSSSGNVYNQLVLNNASSLQLLYDGFEWDRMDEHGREESPTTGYKVPVFSIKDGRVSCQYNRNWIENAANRTGNRFSREEITAFDLMDAIAYQDRFEFCFREGDIQFCNNYTAMHGRAAHAVIDEEERKRVLMRIWLDMPGDVRPFVDDKLIRYGNGRHGQIGWSCQEVLAGDNLHPRKRFPDGTIAEIDST